MREISLSALESELRVHAGPGAMRFVAEHSHGRGLRTLGLYLAFLFALMPLTLYGFAAQAGWDLSTGERVAFHLVGGGFGLAFLVVMGSHILDAAGFVESRLQRPAGGALELEYHWSGGRHRCYRLSPPVRMIFLLDTESGGALGGAGRQGLRYRNSTGVEFLVHAAAVSRRMPLMPRGWLRVSPHPLRIYHEQGDSKAKLALTIEALHPMAAAVCKSLGIPVEFRLAGGGMKPIDTVSPAHEA